MSLLFPMLSMAESKVNVDSILNILDQEISNRETHIKAKEQKLQILKESLNKSRNIKTRIEGCNNLFEEYKSYQFDSALVYANKMLELGQQAGDNEAVVKARVNLIYCYLSVGYYKEAEEIGEEVNLDGVSTETIVEYYKNMAHLHQNLSYYVANTKSLAQRYREAFERDNEMLLHYSDMLPDSTERLHMKEMRSLYGMPSEEVIEKRKSVIDNYGLSDHDLAVQCFILHEDAANAGDDELSLYYLALAAIHDIRGNIRETLAMTTLAKIMLDRGNLDAAMKYIEVARDDALFYGTNVRATQSNSVLSAIENQRYLTSEQQRYLTMTIMAIVITSLIFIVGLYWGLRRKNRLLKQMRIDSENKNIALDHTNTEVTNLNQQLREVNQIKERYIIQSLCADQSFINSVEEKCRAIDRKLKTKQYDDLPMIIRQMGIKQERRRIALAFDQAFLALFPNFIDEFNKLFPPEYQLSLTDDGLLPTEIKIYGLMRLGIDDTATVARYLNISVNTIYVYKAKVKAAALVRKEEFDRYIMAIPKP